MTSYFRPIKTLPGKKKGATSSSLSFGVAMLLDYKDEVGTFIDFFLFLCSALLRFLQISSIFYYEDARNCAGFLVLID